jgi:hypothetical protein
LYATKIGIDSLRQAFYDQCFGKPRHAFEQNVPAAQQGYQQPIYHSRLSYYVFLQFLPDSGYHLVGFGCHYWV